MEEDNSSSSANLETSKADKSVWLMKCPVVVAKSWKNHTSPSSSDSAPLAKVVLSLDPLQSDDPSALQFTMEMARTEAGDVPKSYSLNMFKDFVPMCVFSETPQGKVAMEGKVEHKFDMKPHEQNIEEYHKLCRERTKKSMVKIRQIQVINNDRGVHMRPMPGMVGLISSSSKDKKRTQPVKQSDVKRTRRDRGELEDIMFKLFERQPNWALKQLVQETDQPAQFLKEILNELCVYNKRGTNQGTYELKPEYKKTVEDTGGLGPFAEIPLGSRLKLGAQNREVPASCKGLGFETLTACCKERLVPIACKWMDVCCAVGLGYHSEPNPNRFSIPIPSSQKLMSMELNAFTTLDFLLYGGLGVPQLRDPFLTMVQFKGNVNGDL
ncbi:hypothetical protein D5086_011560 [Populus alba]|uniref:Uncharacterized protein n=1 Tax=Populus alba TaxID=43335 RepID=A0ACC4CE76_POPAL